MNIEQDPKTYLSAEQLVIAANDYRQQETNALMARDPASSLVARGAAIAIENLYNIAYPEFAVKVVIEEEEG